MTPRQYQSTTPARDQIKYVLYFNTFSYTPSNDAIYSHIDALLREKPDSFARLDYLVNLSYLSGRVRVYIYEWVQQGKTLPKPPKESSKVFWEYGALSIAMGWRLSHLLAACPLVNPLFSLGLAAKIFPMFGKFLKLVNKGSRDCMATTF
jgi:hypothetical protein